MILHAFIFDDTYFREIFGDIGHDYYGDFHGALYYSHAALRRLNYIDEIPRFK